MTRYIDPLTGDTVDIEADADAMFQDLTRTKGELNNLRRAAMALYFSGEWTSENMDLPEPAQDRLWAALRDAAGIPPGTSSAIRDAKDAE